MKLELQVWYKRWTRTNTFLSLVFLVVFCTSSFRLFPFSFFWSSACTETFISFGGEAGCYNYKHKLLNCTNCVKRKVLKNPRETLTVIHRTRRATSRTVFSLSRAAILIYFTRLFVWPTCLHNQKKQKVKKLHKFDWTSSAMWGHESSLNHFC
jgi:hypothetical protein